MANMSYCRFHNTLEDLRDCADNMSDEPKSPAEMHARARLLRLCMQIANDYGSDLEDIEQRAREALKQDREARAID